MKNSQFQKIISSLAQALTEKQEELKKQKQLNLELSSKLKDYPC